MIELCEIKGQKDFILVTYRHDGILKTGLYKSIKDLMKQYNLEINPTSDYHYTLGARTNFKSPLDKSLDEYYSWNKGHIENEQLNNFFNSYDYSKIKLDYTPKRSNYKKLLNACHNANLG